MKMSACNWPLRGRTLFITLTYPAVFPTDGRVVAYHRHKFHQAIERRWGELPCAWVREFHERGAAHHHLALAVGKIPERRFRAWAKEEWAKIVARPLELGGGASWPGVVEEYDRVWHRDQGVKTEVLRAHPAAYFAGYVGDFGRAKGYQSVVPEGYVAPGRWWGLWRVDLEWRTVNVSRDSFLTIMRVIRDRRAAAGLGLPPMGWVQGQWLRLPGESAPLALVQELHRLEDDVGGGWLGEADRHRRVSLDRAVPVGAR